MQKLKKLITKILSDYPELELISGSRFQFSPPSTLYYDPNNTESRSDLLLLHELGHYLINSNDYSSDIKLISIESQAWAKAHDLCEQYDIPFDEEFAENHLDSYRDWLHQTSLCRNCNLSGYQDSTQLYHCPLCGSTWQSRIIPE